MPHTFPVRASVAGLRPNEVVTVLEKGEEVLTASSPRRRASDVQPVHLAPTPEQKSPAWMLVFAALSVFLWAAFFGAVL